MEYVLIRTGDAPVNFTGEVVAESAGKFVAGKEQNRWHDLRLYKTEGGNFVLEIIYNTQWKGEVGYHFVYKVDRDWVVRQLKNYDPVSVVQGFPRSPQYAERQANLERWIKQRYDVQVGELLAETEDLFERIS